MQLNIPLMALSVVAVAAFTACDLYRSNDRDFCNSNCAAWVPPVSTPRPTPTPSATPLLVREDVATVWRDTVCREVANAPDAPLIESNENEQVVWLARDARTLCAIRFAPATEWPATREMLIEVARRALESDSPSP